MSQSIATGEGDVATFFWEHLLMDMRVLGKALSAAEDEVAMYLHQIIARISTRQDVTGMCVCSCASMQVTLTTIEGLVYIGPTLMYQHWKFVCMAVNHYYITINCVLPHAWSALRNLIVLQFLLPWSIISWLMRYIHFP